MVEAVLSIITRHPMREQGLVSALEHCKPEQVAEALEALRAGGRAQVVERYGERFWSAGRARFGGSGGPEVRGRSAIKR